MAFDRDAVASRSNIVRRDDPGRVGGADEVGTWHKRCEKQDETHLAWEATVTIGQVARVVGDL